MLYRSSLPEEDLAHSLAQSKLLPEARVKWMADKLSPGERLEDALLQSGSLTEEQLEDHLLSRTRPGISGSLSWNTGTWEFHALPNQFSEQFDPDLIGGEEALSAIWHGVSKHVVTDEVLPQVTDPKKGPLLLGEGASATLADLALPDSFADFEAAVGDGASVEDVFRSIPDSTGGLFKLIWMLECGGVVSRENGSWDSSLDEMLRTAVDTAGTARSPVLESSASEDPASSSPTPAPKKRVSPARHSSQGAAEAGSSAWTEQQIRPAHEERMGCDFYAFLGIPAPSPRKVVDKACKELAQAWRQLDASPGISSENRRLLKDLLAGVQLVWRTLTDPKHKKEYDRRLEMGRPPRVEARATRKRPEVEAPRKAKPPEPKPAPSPASAPKGGGQIEEAKVLISQGKFKAAVSLLESARRANPSDPQVLAELGWATWKARKWGSEEDEAAEEYLRLALTFEPQNTRAMEFLARIAIEKGEKDKAQQILKRILKLTKDSEWARTALLSLQKGHRSETVSRKRGFWRDKGGKS